MPPLITNLPWLSRDVDPVATYQRSQQLVQQMEAQQAREQQEKAELAQRAQEAAMQAQFQQRSLALKEQEARSSVQVEADRLRQRQQGLEFEQKNAEAQQRFLSQPPSVVNLPGMPPGIQYRGRVQFPPRAPSDQTKAIAVHVDNDPSKQLLGYDVGGAFQALRTAPTAEEKGRAAAEKAFLAAKSSAESLDKRLLVKERDNLEAKTRPGSAYWEDATEEQRAQTTGRLAEIQKALDAYRAAPKAPQKAEAQKPAKQVLAEERAKLANRLQAEHKDWDWIQVRAETYKQIP